MPRLTGQRGNHLIVGIVSEMIVSFGVWILTIWIVPVGNGMPIVALRGTLG
jgi:hypothetical protein